ncbi:MAG TPA: NADP-dependent malic enzyme [Polyangiaceae bacterium]|jgi:malate dehydrogenase (oxaloacetate-decarboxylating)(NADP+)
MSKTDALRYHSEGRPGKIEVVPTKPCLTQRDLSLAYSPGVAEPCLEIAARPDAAFEYTAKANLVAVVSNGTAVLGLGDIGPLAGKPVMEGKAVLFKKFADIDVFDIEIAEKDPQKLIDIIASLEPTFGGINLEDIKAPECFVVERALKQRMQIPVFHDDQHGTAIITAAALLSAADLQGKKLAEIRVAVSGAGASAISCMNLWQALGVRAENIVLSDSKGVLHEGRRGSVDVTKEPYLRKTQARTLADAMKGADVFVGLSKGNSVTAEMVAAMSDRPIIFALANPDPEIPYEVARAARPDAIIGTGRSDYPNQVNNVLGFPYIFRGALDVGARQINDEMKLAAARAIAALARESVPDRVRSAYGGSAMRFGRDYILPKPVDERVLLWVAPAVARAAMETGVARRHVDLEQYQTQLEQRLGPARLFVRNILHRVAHDPKRIAFASADDDRVLRSLHILVEDRIARPVVLGDEAALRAKAEGLDLKLDGVEFIAMGARPSLSTQVAELLALRGRRGMTGPKVRALLETDATVAGLMMVRLGEVDGLVAGLEHGYPETIRLALQLVGAVDGLRAASGVHVVVTKRGPIFFADTTVNISPDAAMLADIALMTARFAREVGVDPHVALLSYANFGSSSHPEAKKVAEAVRMIRQREPDLDVEGEMQVQIALDPEARMRSWPHATLRGEANVLVFPNLGAGNTAYQLLARLGGGDEIGPVLLGLRKPVTVVPPGCSVDAIVQMTAMTALQSLTLAAQPSPALPAPGSDVRATT